MISHKHLIYFYALCCAVGALFSSSAHGGEKIYLGDIYEASHIDPLHTNSTISANLLDIIYDPLIEYTSDGEMRPALAKNWRISEDKLSWTFFLEENVKFHNGKVLSAEDVKATYDTVRSFKNSFYRMGFSNISAINVISKTTINIKLKKYDSFLPFFLRHIYILPKESVSEKTTNDMIIGTGPFKLQHFSPQYILLAANEEYYRGRPNVDQVAVKIFPNHRTALAKLIAGEINLLFLSDFTDYDVFSNVAGTYLYINPIRFGYWMIFNMESPFLENKHLRQALGFAIDKERIVKSVQGDLSGAIGGYEEGNKDELIYGYDYDPHSSLDAIRSAGWKSDIDGFFRKDGKKLILKMAIWENNDVSHRIARYIQDDYEKAGIALEVTMLKSFEELMYRSFARDEFDIVLTPNNLRGSMELSYLLWHSKPFKDSTNISGYKNKKADIIFEKIRYGTDASKRKEVEQELATILYDDPPGIPLFIKRTPVLSNKKLVGLSKDPFNYFSSFRKVRIVEEK